MRGPISSLARQLQRDDTGERLLHGSKNGSHSILQSQKILKLIKAKTLLLPQHRRNPSWIELRIGSLGLLHRFGLGIGCVHHISNELGKTGKNRYRINAGGVASIECPVPTSFSGARKDFWDRPDEDGKIRQRPSSVGQLLGKSRWEKPLADWITATGVGLVGQDRVDQEDERVERNDGWRREPFL
jgi:hypothetical protein